jgi:hypothetical protein
VLGKGDLPRPGAAAAASAGVGEVRRGPWARGGLQQKEGAAHDAPVGHNHNMVPTPLSPDEHHNGTPFVRFDKLQAFEHFASV